MGRITDIVKARFADLKEEEIAAVATLDDVAEGLALLDDETFALALIGLLQAVADKKAGENLVAIIKKVVPALMALV